MSYYRKRGVKRRAKRRAECFLVCLVVFFFAGCTTTRTTDFSRDQMIGVVYAEDGLPVAGAEIRVDRFRSGVSDSFGRFRIEGVPAGKRTVVVTADGFETARNEVHLENRTRLVRVDLVSLDGLTDLAIATIEQEYWIRALDVLERMQQVAPVDPRTRLVERILRNRQSEETAP